MRLIAIILLSFVYSTVTDIDGNVYETVQIGDQLWMKENLKVTHYNNGDAIPTGLDNDSWSSTEEGAYTIYNDNANNSEIYGNLYNRYTIDDERGICPANWHIPSYDEWSLLNNYLEGNIISGGKLKTTGTIENDDGLWYAPNEGATNESDFSALPCGFRDYNDGDYYNLGSLAYFWSSTETNHDTAWYWKLTWDTSQFYSYDFNKRNGYSIRCLADEIIEGCMDDEAFNFNPLANVDNDSCIEFYHGPIWYVSTNGSDNNNGSEEYPFASISYAFAYAELDNANGLFSGGDTIMVGDGHYYEDLHIPPELTVMSVNGPENTIIHNIGYLNGITFQSTQGYAQSTLKGFTITDGNVSTCGGGIFLSSIDSNPTLEDLIITGNYAGDGGGGVCINSGIEISMNNCIISNNAADINSLSGNGGGGILVYDAASLNISNSQIFGNTAISSVGGGISIDGYSQVNSSTSNVNITNCNIYENSALEGAGIYSDYSNLSIENSIFSYNSSNWTGGAITITNGNNSTNQSTFKKILFHHNSAGLKGGGIFGSGMHSVILTYCSLIHNDSPSGGAIDFQNNIYSEIVNSIIWSCSSNFTSPCIAIDDNVELNISYTDVENGINDIYLMNNFNNNGQFNWLEGNIDLDPLFDDGYDALQPTSPCIDAGDPNSPLDPDGTIADMGAYYYHQISLCDNPNACNYGAEGDCEFALEGECCEGFVVSMQSSSSQTICFPSNFEHASSGQLSAYFFFEVFLDNILIEQNDWVGAFNGDVCVGASRWVTNSCGGGICSVSAFGFNGDEYTNGYMLSGQTPTFKIYDVSENIYYNAFSSSDEPWSNLSFHFIDTLNAYSQYQVGDLNTDTEINIQDIVMLIDLLFSIHLGYEPTDQELELADINFDGNLNVIDVVALVNMVLEQ